MDLAGRCDEIVSDRTRGAGDRLRALLDAAWAFEMHEHPERATWCGFPGENHRWTDRSRAAIERRRGEERALARAARQLAAELAAGAGEESDRLTARLFARECDLAVESARWPGELLAISPMDGVHQDAPLLFSALEVGSERDLEDALARLEGYPQLVGQSIELLREGLARGVTPPRVTLRDVPAQIDRLGDGDPGRSPMLAPFARGAARAATGGSRHEALTSEARRVFAESIVPALRRLRAFVAEEYVPRARAGIAWRDLPEGEAWYEFLVGEQTTTTLPPREIHDVGLAEVERIRDAMERTIRESGFGGGFAAYCEFLRTDPRFFFDAPQALLAAYRDLCKRIDPELPRLFGRLPRLPYGVTEVPAHSAESQTTAYYLPGSLEAGRPGWYYANTSRLESRPRWEMEALSLHEAVPGHHLQISLAQELDLPPFRRFGGCNAYVEGWALYCESLGGELGCYRDPHSRFGQLSYEMWRAIRLVVDTGMHAFGWSRERAIDFFASRTGKPLHDITVEIDRYLVWPAQALSYKIGELRIRRLRGEAERALGARFDLRAFHDELLAAGALPLEFLSERMNAWIERRRESA
jgi:uncharacterized protein (DUF885 family)